MLLWAAAIIQKTMSIINKILGVAAFAAIFCVWAILFQSYKNSATVVFPAIGYEIYTLTDMEAGGFSTSETRENDTSIVARVNIRSGKAYPYAGFGINLTSLNNRPIGYFDFSDYDSIAVVVSTGRMRSVTLRILTDDPVYSQSGSYLSYRPLEHEVLVAGSQTEAKASLMDFKNKEWWLVAQGLDKDDGLSYFYRSMMLEIFNGENVLRGIPDEIEVKSIRLWGENRDFQKGMLFVAGLLVLLFVGFVVFKVRGSKMSPELKKKKIHKEMEKTAELLRTTDLSLAEISIVVGLKSPAQLERKFKKIYKQHPLDYRSDHA